MIAAVHDHLRRCLTVHGVVHLVLDCGKKALRGGCGCVVIQRGGVDVRNFLVELSLREPDLPDLFELPLEKLIGQGATVFEAFGIHRPALDGVILDDLVGPLAELHSALVFDFEAYGDDGL